jgi:hypothetical protein
METTRSIRKENCWSVNDYYLYVFEVFTAVTVQIVTFCL